METLASALDAPPAVQLEISTGDASPRLFDLLGDCRIGRHPSNDLQLAHHRVSRNHAWLKRGRDGSYWISDCGSSNGTFVNRERVQHTLRLVDGDVIRIGDFQLRYLAPGTGGLSSTSPEASEATSLPQIRWLMVADLAGFSELGQRLGAEELMGVVAQWREACHDAVALSAGQLNKQIGDGLLFCWANDVVEPEGIVQTLAALAKLQVEAQPTFRVCLHMAAPGGVALERRGNTEELIGSDVNYAFRMDDVAKSLGVPQLLSQSAAEALGTFLSLAALGEAEVADFPGGHPFYQPVLS